MLSLLPSAPNKQRAFLLGLVFLILFNTMIALFVTYVLSIDTHFFQVWVFSMLIGTSITLLIDLLRWLIWRKRKPHRPLFLLICVIAAPIGYFVGLTIGYLIFDIPIHNLSSMFERSDRILVIMCIVISLAIGAFFWHQSRLAEAIAETEKEKARNAAIEKQAMQAQLQLLQAQIEPHMLFNTLANLQGLIALDTERAQYMLEQLIMYLRASLNSSRTNKTTLKHEFALMKAYLELMAIRMGKRLTYVLDLPTELQTNEIAPMLLQPLVENAIKHGIEPKMNGGHIHVDVTQQDGFLQITVSDTGLGLPFDYDESNTHINDVEHHHVGNANVRERLLALYGPTARLSLEANQPDGVTARICIPLEA
ncbi:MAG: histidine kinase [Pseudomonadota bacterium]